MKFFNIDQHISVIADMKNIFNRLGHSIDDWCLSGHAYVFGRENDANKVPMLAGENWCSVMNEYKWIEFFDLYRNILDKYDGFIVTYPPVFAYLYGMFNKPIIVNVPIRYDYGMHTDKIKINQFNEYLAGDNIILVANNKFDKQYMKALGDLDSVHIPSLCDYTGMKYAGSINNILYYATKNIDFMESKSFQRKENILHSGYAWNDLTKFKAIVHLPYQISTMSIFEQYTANIPLFVPSIDYMMELYNEGIVLEHYTNYKLYNSKPGSIIPVNGIDPNEYNNAENVKYWLQFADYYDDEFMKHTQKFHSIDDLVNKLSTVNMSEISESMQIHNIHRREYVFTAWEKIIDAIK